jgi:LPS export ABC transporter protein LptC
MPFPKLLLVWPQLSLLTVLLLGALASAYLAVQLGLRQERVVLPLRPGDADFYASGVHLLRYDRDGQVSVQMRAERLEHVPSKRGLELRSPVFWILQDNGGTIVASSRRGVGSDDAQTARLEGEVRLMMRSANGDTMEIRSELALIEKGGALIRIQDRVRIERAGAHMEGAELVVDDNRKTFSLGPRVSAFFPASPESPKPAAPKGSTR